MDKSILKKATSDSPEPTQGPLYRDLGAMTFVDEKTSRKMTEWLMDRMKGAKKPYTIIKSLKVIKHCASAGHPDFQKAMQKASDDLRPYSTWKGSMDPVMGDSLNAQIRAAAKEAFEAIFSEQKQAAVRNSMESFGSTGRSGQDVGGTSFRDPTSNIGGMGSNKLAEAMAAKNAPAGGGGMFGALAGAMSSKLGIGGAGASPDPMGYGVVGEQAVPAPAQAFNPAVGFSAVPSPTAGSPTASQPKWGFTTESAGPAGPVVKDSEVLTPMQTVVAKYVTKSSSPGRSEITQFIREAAACECEEGDDLAARLDEKLDPKVVDKWQVRLNTLVLIDALLGRGNEEVKEYFTDNPEDIQKNLNVIQTTVKEKAKKVLTALGVCAVSPTMKKSAFNQQVPIGDVPGAGNQLGVEISIDPNHLQGAAPEAAAKPKKETKLKKRKKKVATDPADEAAAAAAVPTGGAGLFGFAVGGAAAAAAPQPAPEPEKPQAPAGHADLFAMLQKQHAAGVSQQTDAAQQQQQAPLQLQQQQQQQAALEQQNAEQAAQLHQHQLLFAKLQAQQAAAAAPAAPVAAPTTPPPAAAPTQPAAGAFDFLAGGAVTPQAPAATPAPPATPAVGAPTPGGTQVQASGFDALFGGAPAAVTPTQAPPAPTPAPTPLTHQPTGGTFDFLTSEASSPTAAAPTPFSSPVCGDPQKAAGQPDFMAQLMAGGGAPPAAQPAAASREASPTADFMAGFGAAAPAAPAPVQPPAMAPPAPAAAVPAAAPAAGGGVDLQALMAQQQALQAQIAALQAQQQQAAPPQNPPGAFPFF